MKVKERIGKFVIFITIIVVIYIIVCYLYASWKKNIFITNIMDPILCRQIM